MHEIGIAESVLESVRAELGKRPGSRGVEIGLKVGELSGVEPEALRFSLESLVLGTDLEPMRVQIETCLRRYRCSSCNAEFPADEWDIVCPRCGGRETQRIGGDELELSYLELEEEWQRNSASP